LFAVIFSGFKGNIILGPCFYDLQWLKMLLDIVAVGQLPVFTGYKATLVVVSFN
jgi:hypothetical protein